ncbi:MAG: hypothetical protein IMF10_05450 [Proteobacteria bacterium]|nr:hypothetical protein [Pseudomonadota bacterium]
MTKEQLKKRYDGKKIGEIESGEIKENKYLSIKAQRDMVRALSYLKDTERYKENPLYRKSDFANYLAGQYNMRENTFFESERAFTHYPEETKKYGVGLVAKVYRKCGARNEKKVFQEIEKAQGKLKTPIRQDEIESIIQKYSLPPKAKAPAVDYETLYLREVEAHGDTRKQLAEAKRQIERLKTIQ